MKDRMTITLDEVHVKQALEALGPRSLGFALRNATNKLAFEIKDTWQHTANRVFKNPVPLTQSAVLVRTAGTGVRRSTTGQMFRQSGSDNAEIFLRDEAFKGNPPVKYLFAQVQGGPRRHKGFERLLISSGAMPSNMFAVPAKGVQLDAFGNFPRGLLVQILSQLKSMFDPLQNETANSRERREKSQKRNRVRRSRYFAVSKPGPLPMGIYERFPARKFGGQPTRMVMAFVRSPSYTPRYTVFDMAEKVIRRRGERILSEAVIFEVDRAVARMVRPR